MRTSLVALAVSGALVAGLFTGAVLSEPTAAVAQETTEDGSAVDDPTRVQDVLDGLVADGTLTQVQADAVAEALAEIRLERGTRHGPGHRGGHVFAEIADILGMEPRELRDAIVDGATIADLATDAGVTTDDIVAALLAEASERIGAAVESGRIDAADAEMKLADIEERLTALVNGEVDLSDRPFRHGPRFQRGMGGDAGLDA